MEPDKLGEMGWFSRDEMRERKVWPATEAFFRDYIDRPGVGSEGNS